MRLLVSLALLLAATAAGAQDEISTELRDKFREATAAYEADNVGRARTLFLEIWEKHKTYDTALNLADVEFALGNHVEAAYYARWGLEAYPPTGKQDARAHFKQLLAKAKAEIATIAIEAPDDAVVRLDGVVLDRLDEVFATPGEHRLVASLGVQTVTEEIVASRGAQMTVSLEFPVESPPVVPTTPPGEQAPRPTTDEVPPSEPGGTPARTIAIATAGAITAISLGAHIGLRVRGARLDKDADELRTDAVLAYGEDGCAGVSTGICGQLEDELERRNRVGNWGNATLVTTIVFGTATVAAVAWPKRGRQTSYQPWVAPGAGGMTIQRSF
jgi:hypothetical protein